MTRARKTLSDTVIKRFMKDPDDLSVEKPITTVSPDNIKLPSKRQPRRYFDPTKLNQLIASIKEHGILEPLVVRPLEPEVYEIIAGERRLRAAQELKLPQVPVVVKELTDQEAPQVALMENLQRDDLNPLEETEAILELLSLDLAVEPEQVKSLIYQAANAKNRRQELKGNVSLQLARIEESLKALGRFNLESFRSSSLPLLNILKPEHLLD